MTELKELMDKIHLLEEAQQGFQKEIQAKEGEIQRLRGTIKDLIRGIKDLDDLQNGRTHRAKGEASHG